MRFADAVSTLGQYGFMTAEQGKAVYEHLRSAGAHEVLELGTAYGVSAGYMAAAVDENGGGSVTTVDRYHFTDPLSPEQILDEAGLSKRVNLVRIEHSSYNWWLKQQVEARTDRRGRCEPVYDFCYLDGAHNFTIDGLAVVLVERLLKPGGWLLLDDLGWSYRDHPKWAPDDLSDDESTTPHIDVVFRLLVQANPAFDLTRVQDKWWGWARKRGSGDAARPVRRRWLRK
jgi:predicted O-methyltransferase YrrM